MLRSRERLSGTGSLLASGMHTKVPVPFPLGAESASEVFAQSAPPNSHHRSPQRIDLPGIASYYHQTAAERQAVTPAPETKYRPVWPRWIVALALGIPAMIALHYVVVWLTARSLLQRETARFHAEARIQSWQDVEEKLLPASTPESEERAQKVREALAFLSELPADDAADKFDPYVGTAPKPDPDEPLPAKMCAAIAAHLWAAEPALQTLRTAAGPGLPLVDVKALGTSPGKHYAAWRNAARFSALSCLFHAAQGAGDRAVEEMIAGLRIADLATADPTLMGVLVGDACRSVAIGIIEQILARSSPSAEILAELDAQLAAIPTPDYRTAMEIEWFSTVVDPPARRIFDVMPAAQRWRIRLLFGPAWETAATARDLEVLRRLIEAWGDEPIRVSALIEDMESKNRPFLPGWTAGSVRAVRQRRSRGVAERKTTRIALRAVQCLRNGNEEGVGSGELAADFVASLPDELQGSCYVDPEPVRDASPAGAEDIPPYATVVSVIPEEQPALQLSVLWEDASVTHPWLRLRTYAVTTPPCEHDGTALWPVERDGRWGFIGSDGALVIPLTFLEARPFGEGLAAVRTEDGWGYINEDGAFVLEPMFAEVGPFSEGLAAVATDEGFGYIDTSGRFVLPPKFESAEPFSEGLAAVTVGGLTGFVDTNGVIIVTPRFEEAGPFSEGLAAAREPGGRYGYIDREGTWSVDPLFLTAEPFHDGAAFVTVDEGYAQIDPAGAYLFTFFYADVARQILTP